MPEAGRPLEPWAGLARNVFWAATALGAVLAILDDVIDRRHGVWLVVSIVVSVAWTVSLAGWGAGAWRRRRAA